MLGLADKSKIISLFKEVLSGNERDALKLLKELIDDGLDAKNFLNDILEILYFFSRRLNLGPIENDMSVSETEAKMINEYSKNIDMQDIGLFWQLTIKTIDDLKTVGNENLTLEMYIMQLVHLNSLDQREGVVEESDLIGNSQEILTDKSSTEISKEKEIQNKVKKQLKSTNQVKSTPIENIKNQEINSKIEISSFQDLIDQSNKEKEIELKFDLERNEISKF